MPRFLLNAVAPLLALGLVLPTAAHAQEACTPEKLSAELDAYAAAPFSAASWRKLNGLGGPVVTPENSYNNSWSATEAFRKRAAELAPDMQELQNIAYDCRMGYPLEVLDKRVASLGKDAPYIKQWLMSQARVVKACSGGSAADTVLPQPIEVKPELAQTQQEDRAYQEASVAFYAPDKAMAVQMFRAIAASSSQHRAAARYNVANLLANAKNIAEARSEIAAILADPALASVHTITKELQGYIANLEDTAEGWTGVIENTVATLSQPESVISASQRAKVEYAHALYDIDFAGIREKRDDWWLKGELPENPTLSKALVDASRKHPMVLWMMAGQSIAAKQDRAPWSMQGAAWNAWAASYVSRAVAVQPAAAGITASSLDLLQALAAASDDASRASLWSKAGVAAGKAKTSCGAAPETAAAVELALQATRASAQAGKYEEIYEKLAALPLAESFAYANRLLPKLMQNILATGQAEEGHRLRDRLLTPALFSTVRSRPDYERDQILNTYGNFLAWIAEDEGKFVEALALSTDKVSNPVLNMMPAKALGKLADNPSFSEEQRALLSRAGWTRDYARGRTPAKADTEKMLALNPEISTGLQKTRTEFPKLRGDRVWLLTMLRNPRFGILVNSPDWSDAIEAKRDAPAALDAYDHNDKNWWCPLQTDRHLGDIRNSFEDDAGVAPVRERHADELKPLMEADALAKAESLRDRLLKDHPMVKAVKWAEIQALARAPSAPKALAIAATRWAKAARKDDAGAPEALALALKVVRYGCNWHGGHKAYSRPAQELLHAKFAETKWAKETPYWFDCFNEEWDAQGNRIANCRQKTWPPQKPLR